MFSKSLLLAGLAFSWLAHAASSNITSAVCASPSGFDSCFSSASTLATACVAIAKTKEEIYACGCVLSAEELKCAVENCWNQVYSCEYQTAAVRLVQNCGAPPSNIPYFPAPENAPHRCSCNLGNLYLNITYAFIHSDTCVSASPSAINKNTGCLCCTDAAALTSFYAICPNTDPSLIGYDTIESNIRLIGQSWSQCAAPLNTYDCVKDFKFSTIGTVSKFLSPASALVNGTQSLFNTGASITSPIDGPTKTWVYSSSTYTFSFAAYNPSSVAATGTASSGAGSAGSAASGSTATASAAQATKSSSAVKDSTQSVFGLVVLALAVALI